MLQLSDFNRLLQAALQFWTVMHCKIFLLASMRHHFYQVCLWLFILGVASVTFYHSAFYHSGPNSEEVYFYTRSVAKLKLLVFIFVMIVTCESSAVYRLLLYANFKKWSYEEKNSSYKKIIIFFCFVKNFEI